uniref:Vittatine 11-hydroxylase n=1 Tax=Galanthus sp. MBK-2015 TaxID=1774704 RepID=A0A1L2LZ01_9ASPA|nr:vittatine 11-hydroxylase [Galanthus sp. MBK-2015]
MGSDVKSIPIIDITPLMEKSDDPKMAEDGRVREVVRQLDEACKEAGFFYVKGHGVPDSLVKEAREVTRKFFDLSDEEKHKIKLSSTTGYRGYQVIGGNLTAGNPDFHEAINSYKEVKPGEYGSLGGPLEGPNLWPDNPSNFKYVIDKYTWQMKELGRKLMRGVALALGGPVEAFEGDIAGNDFWMMRLIGYPGLSDSQRAEIKLTDIGCGAHTDDGLVTFINQTEDIQALQVKNRSGNWINATPIPGTFVCLLAEMVKILSNGIYEATMHRVFTSSSKYRVSVAFFYETTFDKRIGPFDFCVQKTGGVAKCEVAVYGNLLAEYVAGHLITDK